MTPLAEAAALAVGATGVIWVGSTLLESASENLSDYYGLPAVVQGAVVVAIGSSFPELATVVISTVRHGAFDLGVGAIVGSAIFNVLVIPAVSGLACDGEMESSRAVVYKEAQFYMLSVSVLVITFALGVIYNPVEAEGISGEVTRPLAAVPVALYGLYVFIQYQDVSDHGATPETDVNPYRNWALLAVSLVLIVVAVEGIVEAALAFGDAFGTPSSLWGLTVVAAATSLPDAFVSVRAARDGSGAVSLGNVLGSNVFDLLVAVPVGVLIAGSTVVNFAAAVPMMGFLTLATVVLFTVLRTDLELSDPEAATLVVVYALFVAWMVAETLGYLALVPGQ